MDSFAHIDNEGHVRMVDVTGKNSTERTATAQGLVWVNPQLFEMIKDQRIKKGNVLETSRIAGIMAAKKTWELIPMCHPLLVTHVQIDFFPDASTSAIKVIASVRIIGQTGVEMEALTAVSVAALTIYDMCKSYDRAITISDICLLEKSGGKSGLYRRNDTE